MSRAQLTSSPIFLFLLVKLSSSGKQDRIEEIPQVAERTVGEGV